MQTVLKDSATADGIRTGMKALYVEMPDSYSTEYSAMFHRIAAGDLPKGDPPEGDPVGRPY